MRKFLKRHSTNIKHIILLFFNLINMMKKRNRKFRNKPFYPIDLNFIFICVKFKEWGINRIMLSLWPRVRAEDNEE